MSPPWPKNIHLYLKRLLLIQNAWRTDLTYNIIGRSVNGKCLKESLVYQAEINTTDVGETKICIGMTSGTFKKRYANQKNPSTTPVIKWDRRTIEVCLGAKEQENLCPGLRKRLNGAMMSWSWA